MTQSETQPEQKLSDYPIQIGDVIDGRFRVQRVIGSGAMGLVVEAWHLELNNRVAMKFLRPSARTTTDAATRFAREARASAKLKGEHIARVSDVGETEGGVLYIVMEYLEGSDLDELVAQNGRYADLQQPVLFAIQICEALAEAHSLGIVHRDVKPANIFIVERDGIPSAKLLDFGISKAALRGEYTNIELDGAKTSAIMGSPYYMAPEQVRSTRDVDGRADIWALGAVLFELVTGQPPWRSVDLGKLVTEILSSSPRKLQEFLPDIDERFAMVLSGALEKDVDRRYSTAADFAQALLPFAPDAGIHVERAQSFKQRAGSSGALPALRQSTRDLANRPSRTTSPALSTPAPTPPTRIAAIAVVGLAIVGILLLTIPALFRRAGGTPPVALQTAEASTSPSVAAATPPPATPPTPPPTTPAATPVESSKGAPAAPFVGQTAPQKAPFRPFVGVVPTPRAKPGDPAKPAKLDAGIDSDPWRRNQPKLEDNPFK